MKLTAKQIASKINKETEDIFRVKVLTGIPAVYIERCCRSEEVIVVKKLDRDDLEAISVAAHNNYIELYVDQVRIEDTRTFGEITYSKMSKAQRRNAALKLLATEATGSRPAYMKVTSKVWDVVASGTEFDMKRIKDVLTPFGEKVIAEFASEFADAFRRVIAAHKNAGFKPLRDSIHRRSSRKYSHSSDGVKLYRLNDVGKETEVHIYFSGKIRLVNHAGYWRNEEVELDDARLSAIV